MKSQKVVFRLQNGRTPLTLDLAREHTKRKNLTYYDPKTEKVKALRYATNHPSPFIEDQQGSEIIKGHIMFKDGTLVVDSIREQPLLEFLKFHPDNAANGGKVFEEQNFKAEAQAALELLDLEDQARDLAKRLPIDTIVSIGRQLNGARVDNMSSEEVRRDVRIFAKNNPATFLEMVDDPSVERDNIIGLAVSEGIIQFRRNNTEAYWNTEKKSRICRIPEGEDHIEALEAYFMSNDGVSDYAYLEEKVENL